MEAKSQQSKLRSTVISALEGSIEVINLTKKITTNMPAKAVFGSVIVTLVTITICYLLAFYHVGYELKYT